jgi:hypothetical protein
MEAQSVMGLDNARVVDAIGIEKVTGKVILTIADAWDWDDPRGHLLALQAKLNAYFVFVEDGEMLAAYPKSAGRQVAIDVVTKFPMHPKGAELLTIASNACRDLDLEIRTRLIPQKE